MNDSDQKEVAKAWPFLKPPPPPPVPSRWEVSDCEGGSGEAGCKYETTTNPAEVHVFVVEAGGSPGGFCGPVQPEEEPGGTPLSKSTSNPDIWQGDVEDVPCSEGEDTSVVLYWREKNGITDQWDACNSLSNIVTYCEEKC